MSEPTSPTPRQVNVLLITIDTLRADRVGRGLTPNIDKVAARGTSYTNVRATAPLTLPSHASIMTGLTPPAHGVRENGVVFDRKTRTLARAFRDAGYRTAAFVGAYVLNRRFGLDEGFDTYDDAVRRDPARVEQLEAERRGGEVVDAALKWLPSASSPFFVWVHLYDPHAPYEPPDEFLRKAAGRAYDGEVAYADAQVGRLMDALDSRGLSSSTIIAVAGDHGESLGEHGEQTHGMLAYDSTLRVPMIVVMPQEGAGRIESGAASLTSLGARLLSGVGLNADGFGPASEVYAESLYPRRAGWHQLGVLVEDNWKLILSSERELYDVQQDPGETREVAAGHASRVKAMAAAIIKMQAPRQPAAQVAPDAVERLRALGYVSGSGAAAPDDPKAPNPARFIDSWTSFERSLDQLRARDAATAVPALKMLAGRHPDAQLFQSTYAQVLKDAGRAREAVAIYKDAVRKWPGDAALFHDLAVAAREAGDAAEASRAEQAALALDASSAMALNGLGLLHADTGRAADAAGAFEKAIRIDPTNASYWTNLGNARREMNDARAAETAYRRALDNDGAFADALNGLGTLLVQSGRAAEAVPLFERALQSDPELHEARLNLGIAYQQSGQREKAAQTYRDVLKKTPPQFAGERTAAGQLLKTLQP
jgi:arylsulfatase A-like enzyme/Tfp pilus assembly protein PilF